MLASVRETIIRNYRDLYKAKYGVETICSDDDIIACRNASACAPSVEDQDAWVLEDMHAPASLADWLGVKL